MKRTPEVPHDRLFFVLLALFLGSGASALVYEIVWFEQLQLFIGSSAVSLGVLLATFMGGMCVGSLAFPSLISPTHHPLRAYAALEFATGAIALLATLAIPLLTGPYMAALGSGVPALALRSLVCASCLLPPTILMGATLPAIARWTTPLDRRFSRLGLLYGANIAGGVLGSMVAGFYLLRVHDMRTAVFVAAAINGLIGGVALSASSTDGRERPPLGASTPKPFKPIKAPRPATHTIAPWRIFAAIALSGMSALGAEVVWTRLLALMFGPTVYAFSIILAVFLAGLGIGSVAASVFLRRKTADARAALSVCQGLLAVTIAVTASAMASFIPHWSTANPTALDPLSMFLSDLARSSIALLPATCLWGASFPLALAAAERPESDLSRLTGRIYAANTLGGIGGAIVFSMALIPIWGTQHAQQALVVLTAAASALTMAPRMSGMNVRRLSAAVGAGVAALVLAWSIPPLPPLLVAFGRDVLRGAPPDILYVGEGLNSSVAVSELPNGVRQFHVSGKVEASTWPADMRLQRMLGHIPALIHPDPRAVLVVGLGAGVTAGAFVPYSRVERIVICEIEPLIPQHVTPFFARANDGVLDDPRVHVVIDDARHYVLTTHERFDIVTSDPINPWMKGAAVLYTKEYLELVKQHLNPGGSFTAWLPLYKSSRETVKSALATFFDAFPNGLAWGNAANGVGYDLVLFGQAEPARIDVGAIDARLGRPDFAQVAASLRAVGFNSASDLFSTYAGRASDLQPWVKGAALNRDANLRLQYLAGLGLNVYEQGLIYAELTAYRRPADDVFRGAPAR